MFSFIFFLFRDGGLRRRFSRTEKYSLIPEGSIVDVIQYCNVVPYGIFLVKNREGERIVRYSTVPEYVTLVQPQS